mmetsp:Transcript_1271/g.3844  ORF Transcript_1271/g.3844 Transcript_1271/m.3844 type:complete len:202 (-) Transcript_1271:92-697(-)
MYERHLLKVAPARSVCMDHRFCTNTCTDPVLPMRVKESPFLNNRPPQSVEPFSTSKTMRVCAPTPSSTFRPRILKRKSQGATLSDFATSFHVPSKGPSLGSWLIGQGTKGLQSPSAPSSSWLDSLASTSMPSAASCSAASSPSTTRPITEASSSSMSALSSLNVKEGCSEVHAATELVDCWGPEDAAEVARLKFAFWSAML